MEAALADFHRERFGSIQALRGIASLFVVLEHVRFLSCGAFGVDIFFVISGFMIMFSTCNDSRHFLSKRLLRILPLYYLMTVGTYLSLLVFPDMFQQSKADPVFLLKSLLFIPFEIGEGVVQPLMRIGWTINCEIFFYIIFFVSMKISHKYRGIICGVFILLITGAAWLISVLVPEGSGEISVPLQFYGDPVMLEFIFGIAVYYGARRLYVCSRTKAFPGVLGYLSLLCAVCCFLGLLVTKPMIDILGFRRPALWGLPAAVIVLCVFILGLYIRKMPVSLVRLGDASFSLYLMHYYPVQLLDRMVFDFSVCTPYSLFGVAVAIAASVILALFSYRYLERGVGSFLLSVLKNKKQDVSS